MLLIILIISCSFLLKDGFKMAIPTTYFYLLYSLGFFSLRRTELIQLFVFLIPLSNGQLLYYLNVIFPIMLIIKNIEYIKIDRAMIIGFLLILWEAVHVLQNSFLGYSESIIKLIGFSLCVISVTISITNKNIRKNYQSIIYSWTIGFGSFCFILLVKYINYYGLGNFQEIVRRFGWIPKSLDISSTSLFINPNSLGKLVTLTVFCLITLLKYEKHRKLRMIFGILYFIIFGLMSGSRSSVLVFSLLFTFYIMESLLSFNKNKKTLLTVTIVSLIMVFFVTTYMNSTLDMISNRVENEDFSGLRFSIYNEYFDVLTQSGNIIFGYGMQNYNDKLGIKASSHNFFIEIISIWGIIGLIIVLFWFIMLYKSLDISKYVSIKNNTILHYLPLLGLFLYGQTGQFFISYYNTLPTLIIAFANISYMNSKITDQQKLRDYYS